MNDMHDFANLRQLQTMGLEQVQMKPTSQLVAEEQTVQESIEDVSFDEVAEVLSEAVKAAAVKETKYVGYVPEEMSVDVWPAVDVRPATKTQVSTSAVDLYLTETLMIDAIY